MFYSVRLCRQAYLAEGRVQAGVTLLKVQLRQLLKTVQLQREGAQIVVAQVKRGDCAALRCRQRLYQLPCSVIAELQPRPVQRLRHIQCNSVRSTEIAADKPDWA